MCYSFWANSDTQHLSIGDSNSRRIDRILLHRKIESCRLKLRESFLLFAKRQLVPRSCMPVQTFLSGATG